MSQKNSGNGRQSKEGNICLLGISEEEPKQLKRANI